MSRSQRPISKADFNIAAILSSKSTRRGLAYFVEYTDGTESKWVNQSDIPEHIIREFTSQKQLQGSEGNGERPRKKLGRKRRLAQYISSQQLEEEIGKAQTPSIQPSSEKQGYQQENESVEIEQEEISSSSEQMMSEQKKMEAKKKSRTDSFFNESRQSESKAKLYDQNGQSLSSQEGRISSIEKQTEKKEQIVQIIQTQNNKDMELIAEVSDDSSQGLGVIRMKSGKCKNKRKSMPMGKGKALIRAVRFRKMHADIDEDNIMQRRNRFQQPKNYNLKIKNEPKKQKETINYDNFLKNYHKAQEIEDLLISTVESFGMIGPYKYYEVRLRNYKKYYIREKDMLSYFPRKLHEFHQRILNKVAMSTHKINFVL